MNHDRGTSATLTPTASQTVGPFFHIGLACHQASAGANASPVTVRGRVLDGDGVAVPDAVLEVWASGVSQQPDDDEIGFCRVFTNDSGSFSFTATRPRASGAQAPHLAVIVFMRGLLRHLMTRMYLPNEPANNADPVLALVPPDRRGTLVARRVSESADVLEWDVVLQGTAETVFFEC